MRPQKEKLLQSIMQQVYEAGVMQMIVTVVTLSISSWLSWPLQGQIIQIEGQLKDSRYLLARSIPGVEAGRGVA